MKIGDASQITIGTKDLDESMAFYRKLGFRELVADDEPEPWAQLTDDYILLMLRQTEKPFFQLSFFSADMEEKIALLEKRGLDIRKIGKKKRAVQQAMCVSPDDFKILLVNHDSAGMYKPSHRPQDEVFGNSIDKGDPLYGFGEISTGVSDLGFSLRFWEDLGFIPVRIFEHPYPWAVISDGSNYVGLHQSSGYESPAIAYYAKDADALASRWQSDEIQFTPYKSPSALKKHLHVRTPEGYRIFIMEEFEKR